jgi:hypothetical protein
MALKLRRGTEANRTSITPAEGEIIYVTDTKKIYVGDGTTPGGVLQGGSGGGGSLTGITDNATASVLTLSDANISIDVDLSITGQEIVGDGDINISGDVTASGAGTGIITANSFVGNVTGNVTGNAVGAHTGTFDGDMTGSVFSDDSTIIVDGNTRTLHGNLQDVNKITYDTSLNVSHGTSGSIGTTNFSNTEEAQYLKIRRTDAGTASDQNIGLIGFDQIDDTGTKTYVSFAAWHSGLYLGTSSSGSYAATNYVGFADGNMAIGDYTPAAGLRLDVRGNVKATGFIQTGSFTTAERDALTGANGMMIYNTTNSRFQIYEAGNWLNMREVSSGGGGGSTDNYSHWNVTADDSTLRVVNGQETIGILGGTGITTASDAEGNITITGTVEDFTDLGVTPTTLAGYGITDAATSAQGALADSAVQPATLGSFTFTGTTLDSSDSSGVVVTPAATFSSDVTVENDLIVTNKIIADTIEVENIITNASGTPEISSDTDIILAAGTRVEVSSSPFKLASFTTTERDALSAENGDMIYNTTLNKFQGYENGAWASLI